MTERLVKQELRQAESAGERALESLYILRDTLNSAKNWGLLDLFGGGAFTGLIKHSKMETAAGLITRAKKDLESFQKELKDVPVSLDLRMEIGSFLSFADFFFDDPVSDYLVYSRIQNTREDVEDGIQLVEELLEKLTLPLSEFLWECSALSLRDSASFLLAKKCSTAAEQDLSC